MKIIVISLAIFFVSSFLIAAEKLFPEIPGWQLKEEDTVYTSDNLWEWINGAADLYIEYGFQDLHRATYTNHNEEEVQVELYHHNTPENTFGIYTSERMPDYVFITIGVQGYISTKILNFFTGNYYIKINKTDNHETGEETIQNIAGKISASLNQTNTWPGETALFPEEGKVYMSEGYVASNFMGYSFFHSAFTAKYSAGGDFNLFIIHGRPGEAETMLNKYIGLMKEDKIMKRGNTYIIQDIYNGKVIISVKGEYLAGVINSENENVALEYIQKILDKIN
jgi:hypothetical protein